MNDKSCLILSQTMKNMNFIYMTEIQALVLPLLEGRDLVGAVKTECDKTLAFLISAVELIYKWKFMPYNVCKLELSMQTFGVLEDLMKYHYHTYSLLLDGANRQTEVHTLEPIYVEVDDDKEMTTMEGLQQDYIACRATKISTFVHVLKEKQKKVMVFFNSCMSVKYYYELLNYIDLPAMNVHSKQKQTKRITTFHQFCNAFSGILLCTNMAARDLDT
ncbi:DDX18 helicase, partial [Pseudoatta argentina]